MKSYEVVNRLLEDDEDFDLVAEIDNLPDEPSDPVRAWSSHGEITFDPKTGEVLKDELEYGDGECDFKLANRPVRFDVQEWRKHYPGKKLAGLERDILDIGYWMPDGRYEPPDREWRNA